MPYIACSHLDIEDSNTVYAAYERWCAMDEDYDLRACLEAARERREAPAVRKADRLPVRNRRVEE